MISIIAAVSENNVIGNKGEIPWYLSSDLKRFAKLTKGHTVIMGRKTYESIVARIGKPLPDRKNVIITSNATFNAPGCTIFQGLEDAIQKTDNEGEVFIIGGELLYRLGMQHAKKLYITKVDVICEGDAFFPEWNKDDWEIIQDGVIPAGEKDQYSSRYAEYVSLI